MKKIKFGITVKDVVTGFTGVVCGRASYITGCRQYLVSPKVKADGEHKSGMWVDEARLEICQDLERIVIAEEVEKAPVTGGPQDSPSRGL